MVRKALVHQLSDPDPRVAEEEETDDSVPAGRATAKPSKDKCIDLDDFDFPTNDLTLPGWNLNLAHGNGSGTSEVPFLGCDLDDLFIGLPSSFDRPPSTDESVRSQG